MAHMQGEAENRLNPASPQGADALREAEEEFLAAERNDPGSPYYLSDAPAENDRVASRRRFMLGAVAALGVAAAPGVAYAKLRGATDRPVPPDATKVQGG